MTIGLAMIVKNEEAVIERCLLSVRDQLDHWTIIDTGSTDRTPRIARGVLGQIPGQYVKTKWEGFGAARTKALQLAQSHTTHVITLDADMTLEGRLPKLFTPDVGMVPIIETTGFTNHLPLYTRTRVDWRYIGQVHEYLLGDGTATGTVPGVTVRHHSTGRDRAARLIQYVATLRGEVAANPLDARAVFYLAQSYRELDLVQQAIVYYRQRVNLPGWDEETFYARYQLGCLLCEHVSFEAGSAELLAAWRMRPARIEPLRALANASTAVANQAPLPQDLLFVHTDQYSADD